MKVSVVVPAYNESPGINTFHNDILTPHLKGSVKSSYEIIYVNDGSTDDTLEKLQLIADSDKYVKILNLSKNFGKEIAVTAGISVAQGQATIIMDADGQHPPEVIAEFLKKWELGAQVVIGIRDTNQKEGFIKRWGSKLFYKLFNSLSGTTVVPRSTDFRLIDSSVREEFLKCSERQRITRGIIDWLGFQREYIHFHSPARLAGEASYSTHQLIRLALNSFISLTLKPLLIVAWLGVIIICLSIIVGSAVFIEQFIMNDPLHLNFTGSALLGIFITFLVGLVLVSEGVLAVYLSHIHEQAQGRPLFIIDKSKSRL
jgi:dolichol-phosphate mannosyltransferase